MMDTHLSDEAINTEKQLENGCFSQKLSAECHLLGRFLEVVKKDDKKAIAVYKSSCRDGKNGESCYRLGQIYHSGSEGPADHVTAFYYNQQGCQLGHAKSCLNAGMANLSDGFEGCVRQDLTLAVHYLKQGCQLGSGLSCYLLAGVFNSKTDGGQYNNPLAVLKYDFEACQLNFRLACANLKDIQSSESTWSMDALERASHVKNVHNFFNYLSNRVIGTLGFVRRLKSIAMKDDLNNQRLDLLEKLRMDYHFECYLKQSPKDCHHLAHFFDIIQKDSSKAGKAFRKNCDDYQYGPSCEKFASLARNGRIGTADPELSLQYDRLGCDGGQAHCCFNATMTIISDRNRYVSHHTDIFNLVERGCRLGCDNSCYLAGGLFLSGIPGVLEKNTSITYRYDLKACQLGNPLACANITGALPVEKSTDDPTTNGFVIRLMQLKIHNRQK